MLLYVMVVVLTSEKRILPVFQVITIWCITAVATVSTVSGVGMGIRRLSELCFGVGMFVMVVCFFMDNTFFILNLFVQSIGYYFQVRSGYNLI